MNNTRLLELWEQYLNGEDFEVQNPVTQEWTSDPHEVPIAALLMDFGQYLQDSYNYTLEEAAEVGR